MEDFQAFCADFFRRYFELKPSEAITYGIEGYEGVWEDFSEDAYAEEKSLYEEALKSLRKIPLRHLTLDERIDRDILEGSFIIRKAEFDRDDYRISDPGLYLPFDDLYNLIIHPNRDPAGAMQMRLEGLEYLMEQGIEKFHLQNAHPPKLWVDIAMTELDEGTAFLDSLTEFPRIKEGIKDHKRFASAVERAKCAVKDFYFFLEAEVIPKSSDFYAVGKDHFNLLLKHKHFLGLNAFQLLRFGEDLFDKVKAELLSAAGRFAPGKSIADVAGIIQEKHPGADMVIPLYRKAVEEARNFLRSRGLVAFPPKEKLEVTETPVFSRHVIPFAAYSEPSVKDPEQLGRYYVTPAKTEDELREHNFFGIGNTSAHEAYPGHHLQFTMANFYPAAHTLPRLMNTSSTMFEGWALYCEQMMREEGFLSEPEHEFIILKDRLWRALRIIIDVKTQCYGMSYSDAADIMVRDLSFPRSQAEADLNWYSQSPATPMGYALGWSIINRLRRQEKERLGTKFSLCKFHDKFLRAGSIAVPLIEKRYFRK